MPIHIYDAINCIARNDHNNHGFDYHHPFNLKFTATNKYGHVHGPGVYLISFKGVPVYFGKYQPFNRGSLFDDRWMRHIETCTLRGHRVGFGNGATNDNILPGLIYDLQIAIKNLNKAEHDFRFADTGVVASANRRAFANYHWCQFSQDGPETILKDFDFRFYKILGIQNQVEANQVTTAIEHVITHEFNFQINTVLGTQDQFDFVQVDNLIRELIPQNLDLDDDLHLLMIED